VSGVVFRYKGKMPDRPVDGNAVEAKAYLSSGASQDHSDISSGARAAWRRDARSRRALRRPANGRVHDRPGTGPAHRAARQVRIGSANWQDPAIINANYLGPIRICARVIGGGDQRGAANWGSGPSKHSTRCVRSS